MQQRAGLLFLSKSSGRLLLILENGYWTVPTFVRNSTLLDDAESLLIKYSRGKILPIELYLSADRGFEYSTYLCLVDTEFITEEKSTIAWAHLDYLPKHLHNGLKNTLNNHTIKTKIKTVLELKL
jgi:hypothetical protein